MNIVIDGYNLLRHLFAKEHRLEEKRRNLLIHQLALYKKLKQHEVREIVIVFDGGDMRHATRTIREGIVVIFAGQGHSADEWIVHYVNKRAEVLGDLILISQDRKLVNQCERVGAFSMGVFEFHDLLEGVLRDSLEEKPSPGRHGHTQKYELDDALETGVSPRYVDLLMEQASLMSIPSKDVDEKSMRERSEKGKKLSKRERFVYDKIKKMR